MYVNPFFPIKIPNYFFLIYVKLLRDFFVASLRGVSLCFNVFKLPPIQEELESFRAAIFSIVISHRFAFRRFWALRKIRIFNTLFEHLTNKIILDF